MSPEAAGESIIRVRDEGEQNKGVMEQRKNVIEGGKNNEHKQTVRG